MSVSMLQAYDLGRVTLANGAMFDVGALMPNRASVHAIVGGGNIQSGIANVPRAGVTLIFTGISGREHGYYDFTDDEGNLHYYGHGQGDMKMSHGNRAIAAQHQRQSRLLVFQTLGKGAPVRFRGEYQYLRHYTTDSPDASKRMRKALVFVLQPLLDAVPNSFGTSIVVDSVEYTLPDETTRMAMEEVRTRQGTFRRRVTSVEVGCRLTSVADLRFLRASHIKPWSASNNLERVNQDNGLLLTPSADLLFDQGWISFRDNGKLLVTDRLPDEVRDKIGLDLQPDRHCGSFSSGQAKFLEYHRDCVYERAMAGEPSQLLTSADSYRSV